MPILRAKTASFNACDSNRLSPSGTPTFGISRGVGSLLWKILADLGDLGPFDGGICVVRGLRSAGRAAACCDDRSQLLFEFLDGFGELGGEIGGFCGVPLHVKEQELCVIDDWWSLWDFSDGIRRSCRA